MPRKSKQSGFSMLELMIVMALLGIMAAIATPNFLKWRTGFHLKGAARDLLGHMQKAKIRAVKERTDCAISFGVTVNGTAYDYIVFVDADDDRTYDAGEELIARVQWEDDVDFDKSTQTSGTNFPSDTTVFNARGMPNNAGRAYLKNDDGDQLEVIIAPGGTIRIRKI